MNHLSLMVNLILLAGIGIAIHYLIKTKRSDNLPVISGTEGSIRNNLQESVCDEVIAVRKISWDDEPEMDVVSSKAALEKSIADSKTIAQYEKAPESISSKKILFLLKANQETYFAGYELLQILLAAGLRFGQGQLFHRHQQVHGAGDICFSLAAATSTGTFDLQNISNLKMRGLYLFMQLTADADWNKLCFELMTDTAKKLAKDLQANLLDDNNMLLDEAGLNRYRQNIEI